MAMLQTKLGKTPDKAIELGAVFICRSLQASTRVSPKKRRVEQVSTFTRRTAPGVPTKWAAIDNRTGQKKYIPIAGWWGTSAEALEQKAAQIRFSGLARMIWWRMLAKISVSQAGAMPTGSGKTSSKSDRLSDVRFSMEAEQEKYLTLSDKARYAALSFKTSGRGAIDTAMRRAANAMRKYVERQSGDVITQQNLA